MNLASPPLDNRMRFNVAIFDAKYKGYQANFPIWWVASS